MPTRNINLTDELENLGLAQADEDRYEEARDILRAAIDEGDVSGVAEGEVFAQVRKKLALIATRR